MYSLSLNIFHKFKVLPDLDGGARLRVTNNGNILHSGGTISGRREGGVSIEQYVLYIQ